MSSKKPKPEGTEAPETLPASFEEAIAELETLVQTMDSQKLGLDQLLTQYKRGAFLVTYCRERLTRVREEVATIELSLSTPASEGGP